MQEILGSPRLGFVPGAHLRRRPVLLLRQLGPDMRKQRKLPGEHGQHRVFGRGVRVGFEHQGEHEHGDGRRQGRGAAGR